MMADNIKICHSISNHH